VAKKDDMKICIALTKDAIEVSYYLVLGKKEKREAAREPEAHNAKARADEKESKQECSSKDCFKTVKLARRRVKECSKIAR
ncbi:hypothetical protein Tco_0631691, partial [Tanacetum coccineum]